MEEVREKKQQIWRNPIRNIFSLVTITLLVAAPLSCAIAADKVLSIQFSKKNQVKTGLTWIRFKPKLLLAGDLQRTASQPTVLKNRPRQVTGHVRPVEDQIVRHASPYNTVGKLFFTHNTGEIASCSGAFAGAQQVIVTAAHCVMNSEGDWNSDFLFIKGYGSPEQEMFAIECIALPEKWGDLQGEASLDFDYAFLRTKRLNQENSWEISDQPPPEKLTIVGYSDKYYDGKHMIEVVVDTLSTLPFRIGSTNNSLGKGSSGSPWFGEKFVHSVSSHYLNKRSDVMWGPRMSDETQSVLAYTQNHCTPSL